ncbi:MAG TPA: hypothetical protein VN765_12980, partial [Candidatus Acidoferrum sp.]|nr:hypothetical protein [Candidatus Acidoferrum sp.]
MFGDVITRFRMTGAGSLAPSIIYADGSKLSLLPNAGNAKREIGRGRATRLLQICHRAAIVCDQVFEESWRSESQSP